MTSDEFIDGFIIPMGIIVLSNNKVIKQILFEQSNNKTHVTGSGSLNTICDTDPMLVLSQIIRASEVLRICFSWSGIKKVDLFWWQHHAHSWIRAHT